MKQITHCFVCRVINESCACCFSTHYPVWDTCLLSEFNKTTPGPFFMNDVGYWHVIPHSYVKSTPVHSLWLDWVKACVYSGSDRWQGDKCYTEGVSTVKTASKTTEICGLQCSNWHCGSYSCVVVFFCLLVFSRTFNIPLGSHKKRSFWFQRNILYYCFYCYHIGILSTVNLIMIAKLICFYRLY